METLEVYSANRRVDGGFEYYDFLMLCWCKRANLYTFTAFEDAIDAVLETYLDDDIEIVVSAVRPEYNVSVKQWKEK